MPQGSRRGSNAADVRRGFRVHGVIGHSGALQTASRLARRHVGPDGTVYPAGRRDPAAGRLQHARQPVRLERRRGGSGEAAAGVHFVVFNPTSDDFHRVRHAMDGILPDGKRLAFPPRAEGQGFNSILRTTRRQNFLVPPRAHRSFPLAELQA